MDTEREASLDQSGPTGGGRFSWWGLVVWLSACVVLGVPVAWAAVVAESDLDFAPLVIFPLLVGVGLGAMMVGWMRLAQVANRPTVVLAVVLAVLVTTGAQHYIGYLKVYRWVAKDVETQHHAGQELSELVEGWIPTFGEYLQRRAQRGLPLAWGYVARDWSAWLIWAMDGLLVLAAASAMVIPAMRQPYCNRCRSWYRVTRSGRIDVSTARRVAELADVPAVARPTAARYRMLHCNGGCGPTGFYLTWDESPGGTSSIRVWLDAESRDRITQALDEALAASGRQ